MGYIIGNKVYVGSTEAGKIYLGSELVYEKGVLFSMPGYNHGVPRINTFGNVTFIGGSDQDGWIGYDPSGAKAQNLNITPYASSFGQRFIVTLQAKWIAPSSSSTSVLVAIRANSDLTLSDGSNQVIGIYIGVDASTGRNKAEFGKNLSAFMTDVVNESDRQFELGCYVDTSSKRCYMGMYNGRTDSLRIPKTSNNYLEYSSSLNFDMAFSVLGSLLPTNAYKNIAIKKVENVDIDTGRITY